MTTIPAVKAAKFSTPHFGLAPASAESKAHGPAESIMPEGAPTSAIPSFQSMLLGAAKEKFGTTDTLVKDLEALMAVILKGKKAAAEAITVFVEAHADKLITLLGDTELPWDKRSPEQKAKDIVELKLLVQAGVLVAKIGLTASSQNYPKAAIEGLRLGILVVQHPKAFFSIAQKLGRLVFAPRGLMFKLIFKNNPVENVNKSDQPLPQAA